MKNTLDTILIPSDSDRNEKSYLGLHTRVEEETITMDHIREHNVHPKIVSEGIYTERFGSIENSKAIYGVKEDGQFSHLNTCKDGYSIIDNDQVFGVYEKAMSNVDHKISAVGTYNNLKNYFIEVELGENKGFEVNGDQFGSKVLFLTGHDGKTPLSVVDTSTRFICQNVLKMIFSGEKALNFKVHHKGDTNGLVKVMPKCIDGILKGREHFREIMELFNDSKLGGNDIESIIAGYFYENATNLTEVNNKGFSTRTLNQIEEISNLTKTGLGQSVSERIARNGTDTQTVYDVFNGATEFWSHGSGVGKSTTEDRQFVSGNFGRASDHKVRFTQYLKSGRYVTSAEKASEILALTS